MKKVVTFILVAFLLVFCGAPAYANGIPKLPHAFYGSVTINGTEAPDGTWVSATVESGTVIPTQNPVTTVGDSYGIGSPKLLVQGDDLSGAITFYVNDHEATPSQAVTFEAGGGPTQLDLSVAAVAPLVFTSAATSVTTTRATLNGNLASLGTALSVQVSFEWGGTETTTQTMSSTGPFNFSLSGLSPGTIYSFRAKADGIYGISYGDVMSFTTLTISPTVTTNDATSVTTTSAGLNGSLDSLGTASSVAVYFEWGETTDYGNTATVAVSPLSQAGAFNASLSGLIRGTTYHFMVKADGGVHGTSYGADRTFTTLTTPPVVTIGAVTTPTNVATQELSGTMEDGTTVALTADTAATFGEISYTTATTWSCEVTLVEGSNEITATATDAVGNEGTATTTIVLDTIVPSVTIGAVTTPTNVATQELSGTMEEGTTVALTSAEATFGDVTYDTATWSCDVSLVEGSNVIMATVTDAVGNEGTATTTIVLDTAAPSVTIGAVTTPTDVATQTLSGTMEEGATVALTSAEATFGDVTYDTATWSCDVSLVEGSNEITATATDVVGNEGTATTTIVLDTAVDEIPPAQITDLAANAGSPATTKVILGWTAPGDDGNTGTATSYEIRRSTSAITEANWSSATIIYNNIVPQAAGGLESFVVSRLTPDTSYYFAIQAKDEVGYASPTSNSPSITTEANLPTITGISPTSGENSQAWTLTIDGNNFVDGTNVVRFVSGDNTFDLANVTYASSTRLTADVAKGAPTGSYRARVINDNGTSKLSSVTYEVTEAPVPLPVVTNLIPQMAASNTPVSGVQIFGENLTGATGASFGGTAASNVMVISDTKITVDVPELSAGEYEVKVTTPAGTNEISGVKFMVSDPVAITEDTTEDTTTSEVVKLETNVIPVQLTLTTDTSETATQATDADVEIEVTIPPQTAVTCEGEPYVGNINPPRVVKPDESVLTDLSDDAVVIEMGNPEKTLNFDQDFVATVIITAPAEPVIWYYNMTTHSYELAGKTGTKDGVNYVPGGTKLGQENSTYTMGLLLDQMSLYVAGVKPNITSAPATVTAGSAFTITGTNFHPTAEVYFGNTAGTIVSRTLTTQIEARFPTAGNYTLKVENPDELSDTTSITLTTPPLPPTVTTTSPAAEATGVSITTMVRATFSEAIDEATLSFTLEGVDGSVTYSDTTATFTPSANLSYATIYTASIQASDLAGNPMAEAHAWSFTTRAEPAPVGPPPTPPAPPPGTTDVRGMVTTAGVFLEPVTATSDDELCTLTIPEGTVGLTEELEPLDEITVVIMDEPPPPPKDAHVIGLTYDLGPDGAIFDPPLTLTFSYDPDALPEGVAEEDLVLAYYNEEAGEWVELDGVVDTVNNTIIASVSHFTTFAIIGVVPVVAPPAPARFTIRSLWVSPSELAPSEEVNITVLVANTGGKSGSYTVVLKINEVKEDEERVTIAAGSSRTVTFGVTREEADTYAVAVNGLSGSFTVVPVVIPPEPAAFSISSLSVLPAEVEPGETVAITVLINNTGGESGSYTIVLKIDRVKEDEETVTVAAGESQEISFNVTREEAGSYAVTVNWLSGSFTVVAPEEEEEEEEEVPTKPGFNWPLYGGIIGGVIVVAGLLWYFLLFRRRY